MTKIYLISPEKFDLAVFAKRLDNVLKTSLVPVFQLRLKGYDNNEIIKYSQELKKICADNNVAFILNDYDQIAIDLGLNGVHVGVDDSKIKTIRKNSPENFIIGASCYDSKDLAFRAGEEGADYLSFGAFFPSKTKKSRGQPTLEFLKSCSEVINLPIVTIGGINDTNCKDLVKNGADFISVISYVWDQEGKEDKAIKELYNSINH